MTLRSATLDDAKLLLAWRNEPAVVAMSMSGKPVTEEEHERWLADSLAMTSRHLYIAELDGAATPVGMGVLNGTRPDCAALGYSVAKGYRGQGYGGLIISDLCMNAYTLGYRQMLAEVHYQNTASLLALQRMGFAVTQPFLTLTKELP